jgi:hypothetical protein
MNNFKGKGGKTNKGMEETREDIQNNENTF